LQKFATEAVEEKKTIDPKDADEGYRKAFRTYVVLVWMFCNAALVAIVLNAGGLNRLEVAPTTGGEDASAKVKTYLLIVLWSVAALSGFKFVGAMWYKVHRIVSSPSDASEEVLLTWDIVPEIERGGGGLFGRNLV
jgi:chitin synthase